MKRLALAATVAGLLLLPGIARAGAATDAALGLGAFAVFNQILSGTGVFGGVPAVAAPAPVYAPPAPVYAPPAPVYAAPAPVYVAPPPAYYGYAYPAPAYPAYYGPYYGGAVVVGGGHSFHGRRVGWHRHGWR